MTATQGFFTSSLIFNFNLKLPPETLDTVDVFISNYQLKQKHFFFDKISSMGAFEMIFSKYEINSLFVFLRCTISYYVQISNDTKTNYAIAVEINHLMMQF